MNGKTKMIVGIALALGILSIAFLATPIQAYVNGNANGDLLQTEDQGRLRTHDCNCNGAMLQTQERERLRTQNCDCNCNQTQYRSRQRTNEFATNRICNCTMSMEQYRYQYREITRSPGQ